MAKNKPNRRELSKEDFQDKNVKARVTTYLDLDILKELKRRAAATPGVKYQALLNSILRNAVLPASPKDQPRVTFFNLKPREVAALMKVVQKMLKEDSSEAEEQEERKRA
jgi:hypothetical protein